MTAKHSQRHLKPSCKPTLFHWMGKGQKWRNVRLCLRNFRRSFPVTGRRSSLKCVHNMLAVSIFWPYLTLVSCKNDCMNQSFQLLYSWLTQFLLFISTAYFSRRKPTKEQLQSWTSKQGWKNMAADCEKLLQNWAPSGSEDHIMDSKLIQTLVKSQKWRGLHIRECEGKGRGIITTRRFEAGEVLCDYHGPVVTSSEGHKTHKSTTESETGYMFFYTNKKRTVNVHCRPLRQMCVPPWDPDYRQAVKSFWRESQHQAKVLQHGNGWRGKGCNPFPRNQDFVGGWGSSLWPWLLPWSARLTLIACWASAFRHSVSCPRPGEM